MSKPELKLKVAAIDKAAMAAESLGSTASRVVNAIEQGRAVEPELA